MREIAKQEGRTRTEVTQIMSLLKLLAEWQAFLAGLTDPKEIKKYSERKLHYGGFAVADNFFIVRIN